MKSFIIITVLAALAVCNAASVPDEVHHSKEDFVVYREGARDLNRQTEVILHDQLYYHDPIWGSTVSQEVIYNGNATVRITGFRVMRPPDVMLYDFLGTNGLRVKLVSNPGQSLISSITIFGSFL